MEYCAIDSRRFRWVYTWVKLRTRVETKPELGQSRTTTNGWWVERVMGCGGAWNVSLVGCLVQLNTGSTIRHCGEHCGDILCSTTITHCHFVKYIQKCGEYAKNTGTTQTIQSHLVSLTDGTHIISHILLHPTTISPPHLHSSRL